MNYEVHVDFFIKILGFSLIEIFIIQYFGEFLQKM